MAFFSVTTTVRSGRDQNVMFALLADAENLDELHEALARDGCVRGTRYRVINDRYNDIRRLADPRETLIGVAGIATVSEFPNPDQYEIEGA